MGQVLDRLSWLITVRPYVTLLVLLAVTVLLGAGVTMRAPPTEGADLAFLPPGHAVAAATEEIEASFADSGDVSVATLVFRGQVLTPVGLSQMDALLDEIESDPGVRELLVAGDPVVAPTSLIRSVLRVDGFDSVTQAEIDSTLGLGRRSCRRHSQR